MGACGGLIVGATSERAKLMLRIAATSLLAILAWSCRHEGGDEELKWSCAKVEHSGKASATPECWQSLQATKSPVLRYYRAIPVMDGQGQIERYALVDRN